MKVGRDYAWYVSYSWTYEWFDEESGEWIAERDFEADRFYCVKNNIKKAVEERAVESVCGLKYRNLKVTINDLYKTTAVEI